MASSRHIVLLTNRPLVRAKQNKRVINLPNPGGLAGALSACVAKSDYRCTLVSWNCVESGEMTPIQMERARNRGELAISSAIRGVSITESEKHGFYEIVSNGFLWPLLHGLMDRVKSIGSDDWATYRRVNERFASEAVRNQEPDTIYWIHDYHLLLAAPLIREKCCNSTIGFFLHTPFPPPDAFFGTQLSPFQRRAIIDGLLGSDLLGFQTSRDVENFLLCVKRMGRSVDMEHGLVQSNGRVVNVKRFPISIDVGSVTELLKQSEAVAAAQRISKIARTKLVYFGVERLDYTKGIPERIKAFGHLLEKEPELRTKVVLIQYASPSRSSIAEYKKTRTAIQEAVREVNRRFRCSGWKPVQYFEKTLMPAEVVGSLAAADVVLVTPLIDGMNLVIKEAVAASTKPTAFILGKNAGAAEELREALLCDARSPEDIARCMKEAYRLSTLDSEQLIDRQSKLRSALESNTVYDWFDGFLTALSNHQALSSAHQSYKS